jgi:hypothetical protein
VNDTHQDSPEEAQNQGPASVFAEQASSEDPFQGVPSNRLEAALHYTRAGLKIFPCEPGCKRPHPWTRGFKDASNILRSLADHPRLKNLGYYDFVCPDGREIAVNFQDNWGFEPGQWGLTGVDIDPKNGGDKSWDALIAEHGPIDTRTVRTPSGGSHLYFRGTITAVNKKLGPGIDTRCFNGYVLLPPSVVNGRPYEWLDDTVPIAPFPEWAREILEAQDERPSSSWKAATEYDIDDSVDAYAAWQAARGEGGRFEYLLSRIGDEASGGDGFADAMTRALGQAVRDGMALDEAVARIAEAVRVAPRGSRPRQYIEEKILQLPGAFKRFRARDAAQAAEARKIVEEAEATTQQEEVAEEPRPFWKPSAARAEIRKIVEQFLGDDPVPSKVLLNSTPGIGKTQTVLELLVERLGKPPRELDEWDLRTPSHTIIAVPTHNLATEIAAKLRDLLREAGWIGADEMVTILLGYEQGCKRLKEIRALTAKGRSAWQLCRHQYKVREETVTKWCEYAENCPIIEAKRTAQRSKFVIVTHEHLALEAMYAASGASHSSEFFISLAEAELVVCDESPLSALFDQKPQELKAGIFKEVLPLGRKVPKWLIGFLEQLGQQFDEGVAAGALLSRLRASDNDDGWPRFLTEWNKGAKWHRLRKLFRAYLDKSDNDRLVATVRFAAEIRRRVEKRPRRKVSPGMSEDEVLKAAAAANQFVRTSVLLDRIADELAAGCTGAARSLRLNANGRVEARGRKQLWDMRQQKWLLLDGTGKREDLSQFISDLEEIRIDVERNAYFIKIRDAVFAKNACLKGIKGKDGKTGYVPKPLLERAYHCIDFFAARYRTVIITTKDMRCAMTGEDPGSKLPPWCEFHGAKITHYGNLRGLNEYEGCEVAILIGRELLPVEVLEDAAVALYHTDPEPIKRLPASKHGKMLPNRKGRQRMRDGSFTEVAEVAYHPDERVDRRRQAMCEDEITQAYDRLRHCNEDAPAKLVVSLVSIPTEQPVDAMPTLEELYAGLALHEWLNGLLTGGRKTAAVRPDLLARDRPDLWPREGLAALWKRLAFPALSSNPPMKRAAIKVDTLLNRLTRHQRVSPTLCSDFAFREGWHLAKYRAAGGAGGEWSLFVYQGDRPNRAQLAAHLEVAPDSLVMMTLDDQPLAAEGEAPTTGDALLDQALALCRVAGMALPLDPKALAALPGSRWASAKAAENWKAGVTVSEILRRGPPEGWHQVEYRLASRRGGRASVAWLPDGAEPRAAIVKALALPEDAVELKRSPWRRPSLGEERSTSMPWVAPLNFAAMLQDEPADVGQLLIAPIFLGKPGAGACSPSAMGSGKTA